MERENIVVSEVAIDDEATFREYAAAEDGAWRAGRPHEPTIAWQERLAAFRALQDTQAVLFVARDGESGPVVGAAQLMLPRMANTDLAHPTVLVPPEHRRRGVGAALGRATLDRSRAEGRTRFVGEVIIPRGAQDSTDVAFARSFGLRESYRDVRSELAVPIAPALDAELRAECEPHWEGYRFESYVNGVPDDLLTAYLTLDGLVEVDSPTGETDFEAEIASPESYRRRTAVLVDAGLTLIETVALDAHGEPVALNQLKVRADPDAPVMQQGTYVHRAHRGHRLGLGVKLAGLAALAEQAPQARVVRTWNAIDNAPMLAVNDRLGFVPLEDMVSMIGELD